MSALVSVIIPAWNAAATLDETLASVRGQSHKKLDIIVVDDGSTDATPAITAAHAAADPRVRLVRQANRGVAAARNHGLALARADLVAPIDADDLWAPHTIARLLAALEQGGEAVALAYAWFALIDAAGRVILHDTPRREAGDVLRAMCRRNLIGNGSAALMRRAAVLEAGGYDEGLRRAGAEGCEDYELYFRIAERHRFAVVRDHLIGYRALPGNMSSDGLRMLRSRDLCLAGIAGRHPALAPLLRRGRARMIRMLFTRALRERRWRDARALARTLFGEHPTRAPLELSDAAASLAWRWLRGRPRHRPLFLARAGRTDAASGRDSLPSEVLTA